MVLFCNTKKMFLEPEKLPFGQLWGNYTLNLSMGTLNTQS